MSDKSTATAQRKPCACCRAIRDILKPTMDAAPSDAIVVVFNRAAVERIYANAKKGAKR